VPLEVIVCVLGNRNTLGVLYISYIQCPLKMWQAGSIKKVQIIFSLNLQTITTAFDVVKWRRRDKVHSNVPDRNCLTVKKNNTG